MKQIIKTTLFVLGGCLWLHSCSNEYENTLPGADGNLVPLVIDGQLAGGILTPQDEGNTTGTKALTRTEEFTGMTRTDQVVVEVEYAGMSTDKGNAKGIYTLSLGTPGEDGSQPCSLAPYAGDPTSDATRNANTVRVPAAGKFTLRIHGMADEAHPISHVATDVQLNAEGKLDLGALSMASAHLAIKVEGAYGEGILDKDFFEIAFETLHAPRKDANNIYMWQSQPAGSNEDGTTGLGNYWLLTPQEETATGTTSGEEAENVSYISIATPISVKAENMFLSLKGADKDTEGNALSHGYIGKTFRVLADQNITYVAGKSYTYTVKLTETTAVITNVEIADWNAEEAKNQGNQPGIYTAQDFIDFAQAWNSFGTSGIGLKKYQKWMNYADTVKVMNNIDLGGVFTAIGTDSYPFTAIFQGDGHTITANGGSLFENNRGYIEAVIRAGVVTTGGGIVTKNNSKIVACINEAPVVSGAAGIASINSSIGNLYGCSSTGKLGNDPTGLTTGNAAGIASTNNSGGIERCYYLSAVADQTGYGIRASKIQILNDAVPALNNGIYQYYYSTQWMYQSSSSPAKTTPKLVRGEAKFQPGIYTAQDFIDFAKAWKSYGSEGLDSDIYEYWVKSVYSSGYHYECALYTDIDLADAETTEMLGTDSEPFEGKDDPIHFNGQNHSISHKGGALFEYIGTTGIVKNLKRAGVITGNSVGDPKQGGIAYSNKGTIGNCINAAEVKSELSAGIVEDNQGTVSLCVNNAAVSGLSAAGIVATNNSKVVACINNGAVTGKYAAGIVYKGGSTDNFIVACITTSAIGGDKATGIMTDPAKSHIVSCINTRTVSGASAAAITSKEKADATTACFYRSITAQQTWGTAVPNLSTINGSATMTKLNQAIFDWNQSNSNACPYHFEPGAPAETTVPLIAQGAPEGNID